MYRLAIRQSPHVIKGGVRPCRVALDRRLADRNSSKENNPIYFSQRSMEQIKHTMTALLRTSTTGLFHHTNIPDTFTDHEQVSG